MKIVTFVLACMAWISGSVSPDTSPPHTTTPQTPSLEEYAASMHEMFAQKCQEYANYLRSGHSAPVIRQWDVIGLHKVINGRFAPFDYVAGALIRKDRQDHQRTLESAPGRENQYGEAEVMLGDPNSFFHAFFDRQDICPDHGHEGQIQYLCTISRGDITYLAAVLKPRNQFPVSDNVPRVEFANKLHRHAGDNHVYTGQLFPADWNNIPRMLNSLLNHQGKK